VNERLSLAQIGMLVLYALGMVAGQFLFKLAAGRDIAGTSLLERFFALLQNGYFLVGVALYFALTVLWIWILTFTPLSRAYPFVALAFAITPLAAAFVFAEPLTTRLLMGIGAVLFGLVLIAG
jgi:multidrug transporter EmrE-like cation transporter